MEVVDFVKLDGRKVRGDSDLMAIYINEFERVFGRKPNCAGCTFNSDFKKLRNEIMNPKKSTIKMENTFKYKKAKGEILFFKKNGKTVRRYDNKLTEDFVIGYLTNGTKEELEDRKKEFSVIPESLKATEEVSKNEEENGTKEELEEKPKRGRKPSK